MYDSYDQKRENESKTLDDKKFDLVSRPLSQASVTASKISMSHRGIYL